MKSIKKVANNHYEVNTTSGKYLQSYDVVVARIDEFGNLSLSSKWDYSNTTKKHLSHWLQKNWRADANTARVREAIADKSVQDYVQPSLEIW